MRKIVFRGKKLENGEWIYGDYCSLPSHNIMFENKEGELDVAEIDVNTLGQYIGSKDKNGKLVFEGDALYSSGYYFTVIFENNSFKSVYEHLEDGEVLIIGEDIFTEDYTIIEE